LPLKEKEQTEMTNAEKFRTPKERNREFKKFCKDKPCGVCPCKGIMDDGSMTRCVLDWLELEYKEVELKPCPFCGKMPTLKTEFNAREQPRYYYVACSCGATFTNADCESDAAERWNRRVK
jgi:Lar family restriction alleviation protein